MQSGPYDKDAEENNFWMLQTSQRRWLQLDILPKEERIGVIQKFKYEMNFCSP